MADREVNYGALIGGISVAASLLVFLVCFLISGVGPKCCRLLVGGCLSHGPGAKFNGAPQLLQRNLVPGAVPTTSPCPVQLPAVGAAVAAAAKAAKRTSLRGCKSAPNPPRPASPAGRRLTPPPPPPTLPQPRIAGDPWVPVGANACGYGLSLGRRKAGKTAVGASAQQLSRSSPLLLLLPGGARRGLSGVHLSLSTIRDCSGACGPIPPDGLYAAAHESESQYAGFRPLPEPSATAIIGTAPSPSATAENSLRAQIGSAYGPLPRHLPLLLPQPLPPPPPPQQRQQQQQQPLSNASSSDCHDWSPPRPLTTVAGEGGGVGGGGGGGGGRVGCFAVATDAVVWASEDGDVAVFDLNAAEASVAAEVTPSASGGCEAPRGGCYGAGSCYDDRSTSF